VKFFTFIFAVFWGYACRNDTWCACVFLCVSSISCVGNQLMLLTILASQYQLILRRVSFWHLGSLIGRLLVCHSPFHSLQVVQTHVLILVAVIVSHLINGLSMAPLFGKRIRDAEPEMSSCRNQATF